MVMEIILTILGNEINVNGNYSDHTWKWDINNPNNTNIITFSLTMRYYLHY